MAKQKRRLLHLVYRAGRWKLVEARAAIEDYPFATRKAAEVIATSYCRRWADWGELISLKIHNRGNGRISEERTYPRSSDPRRYKG